jgi:hypothetical protein
MKYLILLLFAVGCAGKEKHELNLKETAYIRIASFGAYPKDDIDDTKQINQASDLVIQLDAMDSERNYVLSFDTGVYECKYITK